MHSTSDRFYKYPWIAMVLFMKNTKDHFFLKNSVVFNDKAAFRVVCLFVCFNNKVLIPPTSNMFLGNS